MFGLDKFSPTVLDALPSYALEKVSVPSVAVSAPSVPPSEIPLIVELVSPVLSRVPEIVGVNVNELVVGTIFNPSVCPLVVCVVVANVIVEAVVVEYPEPSAVIPPPAPASDPQPNCPVTESHVIFPEITLHVVSPAPKMYPELSCSPLVMSRPPVMVEVAVVEVAMNESAITFPATASF